MAIDAQGKKIKLGDKIGRAAKLYSVDGLYIEIVKVTRLEGDKVYLNDSSRPIKFPNRVVVIR